MLPEQDEIQIVSVRFVTGLSLLAALISAYLLANTLMQSGQPVGCGSGSGCGEVLSSHWSQVFGLPVSVLALMTYLGVAGLQLLPKLYQRSVAAVLAGLLATAAIWFLALQAFVIKAWCPYCVISHLLSLTLAVLLLRPFGADLKKRTVGVAIGLVLVVGLAITQAVTPEADPVTVLQAGANDGQSEDKRSVTVLDGMLTIDAKDVWIIGDPNATTPIIVMFDHACPHCRTTHKAVAQAIAEDPSLCAWLLPVPLNETCNTKGLTDEDAGGRFADSCQRTELAVAIRLTHGNEKAGLFNEWLLEQTPAPTASADGAIRTNTFGSKAADGQQHPSGVSPSRRRLRTAPRSGSITRRDEPGQTNHRSFA